MEEEKRIYWRFPDGTLMEVRDNGLFVVEEVQIDEV